ncbi:MAG: ABC transporter ATP-binding protein/permease [Erysipelotrichaceae bacterium]|jgi:ABC-type bacteriocin/lantibiotic exporter with double-glycine peptidase domain|nr:ABC transporter ATP-binding protein [Lactimicrobium massiliense]MCH4021299.1 ABC transporter ATP-binding protein/permease [Erysipelotrichaceae bacterium]MCI1326858.1 ABC transporter ATP-binding protein/permease [Solobacterium sp.]MCH4043700.1 ABC transporter ATP-binding protein/permease [Erysipelotrichaceae bacterium]MCH4120919.1 ABC transporter ATP-binding protein/permease [Erysipelotrichaceae bacterium]MCI1363558.1 ABC transporter ATP-binding protein/permease [Solobacterium sp.]
MSEFNGKDVKEAMDQERAASALGSLSVLVHRMKNGTFGEILNDWRWIFTYSKKYKGAIVFYTILGIFSTSMGLVSSVANKYLIDIITGYQTNKLWILIAITLISAGFNLSIGNLLSRWSLKLSIRINNEIQADIFDKIIDSEWLSLSHYSNGDVLNRFNSDVGTVAGNAVSWIPNVIIAIFNFIATFCIIWKYNRIMALLAFASAPVSLVMSRFMIRKQRDYAKKSREMSSKVTNFEVETFYNMDTIKSFGISSLYERKLRWWQNQYADIQLDYNMFSIKTSIFMSLVGMAVQYTAFGYCLWLLWSRQITYGTMTLFLSQRASLQSAFSSLVGIIPNFLNSSVSAHRIRELVDLPKEEHIVLDENVKKRAENGVSVHMENVDFAYVPGVKVICQSDFHADPGEIVALVGPSGEGKTTMIRLILGLVHPEKGSVYLENDAGDKVRANADIRYLYAYVPQGNTILSGTIAENMRMVKEDASDEEIVSALQTACAWDFVKKLPKGINSPVGERGRGLSEGQSQRIAIARALLRDAPVLLLDEATSALDVVTERQVLKNIMQFNPRRTCIVTTHRPTVLNMCQRVYRVMDRHVVQLSEEESSRMSIDF